MDATLAYYGHLRYGSELITKLFVPNKNSSNLDGCRDFKMSDFTISKNGADATDKLIEEDLFRERAAIMVARGGCSFVKKSLNI
jgi:hypothetical protein